MEFLRELTRQLTPFVRNMSEDSRVRTLATLRMAYFLSVGSLWVWSYVTYRKYSEENTVEKEQELLLLGKPIIKDLSEAHKEMRESGLSRGTVIVEKEGRPILVDYDREEYLKEIEQVAYERARSAQAKLIAEGGRLPEGALKLV